MLNRTVNPTKTWIKTTLQIVRFDINLEQVSLIRPFDVTFRPVTAVSSKKSVNTFENFDAMNGHEKVETKLMAAKRFKLKTSVVLICPTRDAAI